MKDYIEFLYLVGFGKGQPDVVLSIEEKLRRDETKKELKREAKRPHRQNEAIAHNSLETP